MEQEKVMFDERVIADAWQIDFSLLEAEPLETAQVELDDPLKCKCGAWADIVFMGSNAYTAFCNSCAYGKGDKNEN